MSVRDPGYMVASTFTCDLTSVSPNEAFVNLDTINYSEPAIGLRPNVTLLSTIYSEHSRTVSVFTRNQGEHLIFRVRCSGIQPRQQRCSRFYPDRSRLVCHLASSAAEVAFFSAQFPPEPLNANGFFVRATPNSGRTRLIKITMGDPRIDTLQPGPGQITHPSPLRFTLLNQSSNNQVSAGVLFTYVKLRNLAYPQTEKATVETTWGDFLVPAPLALMLESAYPQGHYPAHLNDFLLYLDLVDTPQIQGSDVSFLEDLERMNLGQITEVLLFGIDILKQPVLNGIYRVISSKIDQSGQETLVETSARLGFIVVM